MFIHAQTIKYSLDRPDKHIHVSVDQVMMQRSRNTCYIDTIYRGKGGLFEICNSVYWSPYQQNCAVLRNIY